jgi:polysaccharide biosynthesis/export protein
VDFRLDYHSTRVSGYRSHPKVSSKQGDFLPSAKRKIVLVLGAAAALWVVACAGPGSYIWYNELPKSEWGAPGGEYVISVAVRVYDQENLATKGKIRSDGRLAIPFAGEVAMAGRRPSEVARELEAKLKEFIVSPRVTINIDESRPMSVTFVGEVSKAGTLQLEPSAGVLQALAQAGGPGQYANKSRIFVLRQFPQFRRIRFTYSELIHNEAGAAMFPLRNGDIIVVE